MNLIVSIILGILLMRKHGILEKLVVTVIIFSVVQMLV